MVPRSSEIETVIGAATAPNYNHEFKAGLKAYEQIVNRRPDIMSVSSTE
jgi:hypothetical protein